MGEIEIDPTFGAVAVVAALVAMQHLWFWLEVIRARRKYGVSPPKVYVDDSHENARAFNCIQRAHQNCTESLPLFFPLLILGGLQHPLLNAAAGVTYMVGRFIYYRGYTSGDPSNRLNGMVWVVALMFMCATTLSFGIQSLLKIRD